MEAPKTVTTPFDAADYIETPEDVIAFLEAALEENDPGLLAEAIGVVSRAKGMGALAQRAGLPRDSFFQAQAGGGRELATLFKIMQAMGMRLDVRAKQADPEPA